MDQQMWERLRALEKKVVQQAEQIEHLRRHMYDASMEVRMCGTCRKIVEGW